MIKRDLQDDLRRRVIDSRNCFENENSGTECPKCKKKGPGYTENQVDRIGFGKITVCEGLNRELSCFIHDVTSHSGHVPKLICILNRSEEHTSDLQSLMRISNA